MNPSYAYSALKLGFPFHLLRDTTITRRRPAETSNSSAPALLLYLLQSARNAVDPGSNAMRETSSRTEGPHLLRVDPDRHGHQRTGHAGNPDDFQLRHTPGDSIPQLGHIGAASETLWPHSRHPTIAIADPLEE